MNNNFNNFNNMDDIFNQLMGNMGGYSTERRRYSINGREVTPEEFAMYRQTGRLPQTEEVAQAPSKGQIKSDGILAKLGRNLTQEAREGKLDPVIGRNKEIQETAEILARRTKNNPVLVGDAGVGKTAVVEGLAQAIVNGDVPAAIKDKEIISIDISGLEAGTQYRGSFEENIQNLVNEVKEAGNIILFFDEIHQILGAGSTGDGSGGGPRAGGYFGAPAAPACAGTRQLTLRRTGQLSRPSGLRGRTPVVHCAPSFAAVWCRSAGFAV